MVQLVEDGQGLPPGVVCGVGSARGVVGVAEMVVHRGFAVAAAEVAEQDEGVVVAGDRPGVMARVVVGVARAVPGVGLPGLVTEVLVQGESLLAMTERLPVVVELTVVPADPPVDRQPVALRSVRNRTANRATDAKTYNQGVAGREGFIKVISCPESDPEGTS